MRQKPNINKLETPQVATNKKITLQNKLQFTMVYGK